MNFHSAFMREGGWSFVAKPVLKGKAVSILGGGPGLTRGIAAELVKAGPVIAVNNAYQLAPEAPLVALDRRWWSWHRQSVAALGGPAIAALRSPDNGIIPVGGYVFQRNTKSQYSADLGTLCGLNSGHAAIHLAMHLGATRIYLAGFDMGFDTVAHWHEDHRVPSCEGNYRVRFRPDLEILVALARIRNIGIAAVTPSLAKIPHADLNTALKDLSK